MRHSQQHYHQSKHNFHFSCVQTFLILLAAIKIINLIACKHIQQSTMATDWYFFFEKLDMDCTWKDEKGSETKIFITQLKQNELHSFFSQSSIFNHFFLKVTTTETHCNNILCQSCINSHFIHPHQQTAGQWTCACASLFSHSLVVSPEQTPVFLSHVPQFCYPPHLPVRVFPDIKIMLTILKQVMGKKIK